MSPMAISALMADLKRFKSNEAEVRRESPWAERFVMGLPLAPWQRDFVWTPEQSARFITSAWTGINLGSYVLTEMALDGNGDEIRHLPLSSCVLDGQQRLRALEQYFDDEIAVPDASGCLTLWSELNEVEKRWFGHRIFDRGIIPMDTEAALRQLYDIMNFGGTPHEEHERAAPRHRG